MKKISYKTKNRDFIITQELLAKTIKVYNGKIYNTVVISEEMLGHKLGEFSMTKKLGNSIHFSEKNKKKKEKQNIKK